jgi:hypothetical protein
MVVMLIALVIVAILAKDALKSYGLLGTVPADAGRPGERTRLPPAAVDGSGFTGQSTPSFQAPMERARGVDATVQRQADDARRQIDDQTR